MSPESIIAVATGTTGLTAFLIYVVRALWIEHQRDDLDVRNQRDAALTALREEAASNREMADVVEKLGKQVGQLAAKVAQLVLKGKL